MSLLEICIGLGILSLLVFFAAPSLVRARDNYELDQTTRQVAGQMEWTRLKAITRDQDCRFRLTSNTSYVIECKGFNWLADETITLPRGFQITSEWLFKDNTDPGILVGAQHPGFVKMLHDRLNELGSHGKVEESVTAKFELFIELIQSGLQCCEAFGFGSITGLVMNK